MSCARSLTSRGRQQVADGSWGKLRRREVCPVEFADRRHERVPKRRDGARMNASADLARFERQHARLLTRTKRMPDSLRANDVSPKSVHQNRRGPIPSPRRTTSLEACSPPCPRAPVPDLNAFVPATRTLIRTRAPRNPEPAARRFAVVG
ncbi:hypothetical protein PYCCODRAFT_155257 [Trametes coccinea BRFM310]|uniref:Uncharacterized protein n=1 Tax=Trametes coccinea (strain BRFM310) TaxID=1353009 RepID=A0A1Y2I531_TRAC3|nr:hypothetical protein PYCCODRAFT_155257 [Trametes coccinea BRFM310]